MDNIIFYEDSKKYSEVYEHILDLHNKKDKNSKVNYAKIIAYLKVLSEYGTRCGEPYVKHLDGDIWELRPGKNRILFACYKGGYFIVLRHFVKKTQKTPPGEIEIAKKRYIDFCARGIKV